MHDKYRIIDADFHVMEPANMWREYIDPAFREQAPVGGHNRVALQFPGGPWMPTLRHASPEVEQGWKGFLGRRDVRYAEIAARNYDSTAHLRAMDLEGVDISVNYPSQGLYATARDDLSPPLAAAICRAYNDWMRDFCAASPRRMYGAAMVSLHDVDSAVAEATRAVKELGMKAVFVRATPIRGRNLGDPYYEPLWAQLEKLGVPLATHEAYGSLLPQVGEARFHTVAERRSAVHPMEQMMALMSLILSGVFERHPRLTLAVFECGASWLPFWLKRLDGHAETFAHELRHLSARPSEYFKRNCYVSTECDDETVKYAIDFLGGADRILFSTDFPHPDGRWPKAVQTFLDNPGLGDADRVKILWDNPARLYGFEPLP